MVIMLSMTYSIVVENCSQKKRHVKNEILSVENPSIKILKLDSSPNSFKYCVNVINLYVNRIVCPKDLLKICVAMNL